MSRYQILARKYRPQTFREVLGQDPIVTTLKNAIKSGRLAHAYLFCGSRGTGKTTLARVFAKALNCLSQDSNLEPCNQCSACKEIAAGISLDVLEIDGASHRGIEDVRQINETVGYAASSGKYKIYIIDEVHMLTKEAFNALLKTLEEPPPKVKFFFATTEPHKVLPTILSRCQRFNLSRISIEHIFQKLSLIADEIGCEVEEGALRLLAARADGGLRDAESLFDQILSFTEGKITEESTASVLGLMPKHLFFQIDKAGKEGAFAKAFEIAHEVFSEGKDLLHFIEGLLEHFRNLLLIKLAGIDAPYLLISQSERQPFQDSAHLYTREQLQLILDMILDAQGKIKFAPSAKIALEALLLKIMRVHCRIPIEVLVKRLIELEKAVSASQSLPAGHTREIPKEQKTGQGTPPIPKKQESMLKSTLNENLCTAINEDPTPSSADLGLVSNRPRKGDSQTKAGTKVSSTRKEAAATPAEKEITASPMPESVPKNFTPLSNNKQSQYDTLLQFAAVELEGKIQKNR